MTGEVYQLMRLEMLTSKSENRHRLADALILGIQNRSHFKLLSPEGRRSGALTSGRCLEKYCYRATQYDRQK